MSIIYTIRNSISGKLYVGQTNSSLEKRWISHIKSAKQNSQTPFHCAIRSYGTAIWEREIVCFADTQEQLDNLECAVIAALRTQDREYGYNILEGGGSSPTKLPEVRAKIASTLTGHKRSPESIAKQKATRALSVYTHSQETKDKIGKANKGKERSQEVKDQMSISAKNRDPNTLHKWTEEECAVRSEKLKGHIVSEETRKKIGIKSKQKVMSIDSRKLISDSMKELRAKRFWSTRKRE